ncbi:MAG: hypothetical protein JW741_01685 [Sedimentisphaerales bacterium]|nr:hypothetical protein [Sedimentisphaerales bacterium]
MRRLTLVAAAALLLGATAVQAADADLQSEIAALQERIAQLEAQQSQQTLEERNAELLRQMVAELAVNSAQPAAETGLTAGYDDGFFIKSVDDQFLLNIGTRLQFRHYYMLSDEGDRKLDKNGTRAAGGDGLDSSASGFELERGRLYFDGHVMKDLDYGITLALGDDSQGNGTAIMYEYYLSYEFMPELGVKAGRFKGPFGKQETLSSGRQMLIDRSLANEIFNIDRVTGVQAFGTLDMGDYKPVYQAMIFNGLQNTNDDPIADNDNSPGVAARMVLPLMGSTTSDFKNASDLAWHEDPVAMLGASFAYGNDRDEDHFAGGESDSYEFLAPGLDGLTDIYELGGETTLLGADASFKYQGLAINLEGWYQHVNADWTELAAETDFGGRTWPESRELDNFGWHAEAGYFLVPNTFEMVSRISQVCVEDSNDSWEYAGGWNWYLNKTQDLKLSMDVTYIDDLPVVSSSPGFDGVQNNALFLVRTQLQFQF